MVKLLAKRRGEALQGKKLPETLRRKFIPFSEIANDAIAYSRTNKKSWKDDHYRMKRLVKWWGNCDAGSLDTQTLEQKLTAAAKSEKWKHATYNRYRAVLMMAFREARRAGKVTDNPARDVRQRRQDNSRVRHLNQSSAVENGSWIFEAFQNRGRATSRGY